jgi:hypothetical protein
MGQLDVRTGMGAFCDLAVITQGNVAAALLGWAVITQGNVATRARALSM